MFMQTQISSPWPHPLRVLGAKCAKCATSVSTSEADSSTAEVEEIGSAFRSQPRSYSALWGTRLRTKPNMLYIWNAAHPVRKTFISRHFSHPLDDVHDRA